MKEKNNDSAEVQVQAEKRKKKKATIDLMPYYTVNIGELLDSDGKSKIQHYVTVPTEFWGDVTELTCTLDYPIEEPHTFKIQMRKYDIRGITIIDLVTLFMAVAKEYEMLSKTEGFIGSDLSELWIEDMRIEGDELIVDVDSY